MATTTFTVELDEDDLRDVLEEIQARIDRGDALPDGESCERGAHLGEIVRDLVDYRAYWEANNPPKPADTPTCDAPAWECRCGCHEPGSGMMHCTPCCRVCPGCGRRVIIGRKDHECAALAGGG